MFHLTSRRCRWQASRTSPVVAGLAVLVAAGPVSAQAAGSDVSASVTFTRDVAPILQQNCQVCHQPGAIGPMSLMTYEEVFPWARVIKQRVEEREMPPYHYDTNVGVQALQHDTRLSIDEIKTISRWVDAGAPMGDMADMPPPVEWPDPTQYRMAAEFGPPDHIIKSPPLSVPAEGQDLWHRPVVDSGMTSERCIRAIEVKPSVDGRQSTHHANSHWMQQDSTGEWVRVGRLSEYALGKLGEVIPPGTCRKAPANSRVNWDIHYFPNGKALIDDQVEIGLWFYPEDYEPKFEQTLTSYSVRTDNRIPIPPNQVTVTQGFHSWDHPVRIDSFQPHGHLRLAAASFEIFYPETGEREMVSMISNWNPGWQLSHIYEEDAAPLIPTGAVMVLTHWYDNTADNVHNPDPDLWVSGGDRTTDEMAHDWIAVTHLDEEGYQEIVAERARSTDTDQ